jgi:hypothetical protein
LGWVLKIITVAHQKKQMASSYFEFLKEELKNGEEFPITSYE